MISVAGAGVAELADAVALGATGRKSLEVQILSPAPNPPWRICPEHSRRALLFSLLTITDPPAGDFTFPLSTASTGTVFSGGRGHRRSGTEHLASKRIGSWRSGAEALLLVRIVEPKTLPRPRTMNAGTCWPLSGCQCPFHVTFVGRRSLRLSAVCITMMRNCC
jgi:hypothetical protein